MTYRRRRLSAPRPGRAWGRRLALALLPLVAMGSMLLPRAATDQIRFLAAPVLSPLEGVTAGWSLDISGGEGPRHAPAAGDELVRLRRQVGTLEDALAESAARLGAYDRRVRDLARIRNGLDGLPVQVVPGRFMPVSVAGEWMGGRLSEGAEDGVRKGGAVVRRYLDRGAREAIARGEPVLAAAGLVGTVEEVGPFTSSVRLVTHPASGLMVQVISRRNNLWVAGPTGTACGSGDGRTVTVKGIAKGADVQVGDFVVTSASAESALPPYLIVGRIVRCELGPAALFFEVDVEPRVAPDEVGEVYVLSPAVPKS